MRRNPKFDPPEQDQRPTPPEPSGESPAHFKTTVACAGTIAILVACWTPAGWLPMPEEGPGAVRVPHLDKVAHFSMFAAFGVLWMRAVRRPGAAGVLAAGLALAAISEAGQGLEAVGRDPDPFDALADAIGLVVGLAAWHMVTRTRDRRP